MRGCRAVGLALVVGLGLLSPAWAEDAAQKSRSPWWGRLFPWAKTAEGKAEKEGRSARSEKQPAPMVESSAVQRARELAAWRRRVEVCDKLREIGLLNKDDNLVRKADQLDQRAWDTYIRRTAQLGDCAGDLLKADARQARLLNQEEVAGREKVLPRSPRPGATAARRMGHE